MLTTDDEAEKRKPEDMYPLVNTALSGEGVVVEHERVKDSVGKFHGLIRLVIQGENDYPDLELWQGMMAPGSSIESVVRDPLKSCRLAIFYKAGKRPVYDDVPAAR